MSPKYSKTIDRRPIAEQRTEMHKSRAYQALQARFKGGDYVSKTYAVDTALMLVLDVCQRYEEMLAHMVRMEQR